MDLSTYNNYLQNIDTQIRKLQAEKEAFLAKNTSDVMQDIRYRQANDRQWFIEHFDEIYSQRRKFYFEAPYSYIVIDFFIIYGEGFFYGGGFFRSSGKCVRRIRLAELGLLWDKGFMYEGYPVVECIVRDGTCSLSYIKDNQLQYAAVKNGDRQAFSGTLQGILEGLRNCNDSTDNYHTAGELRNNVLPAKK